MNTENKEKIEAAVFRRLLNHLQENTDLQNIDLMNLAGFCRNCLSKWYVEASKENGQEINYDKKDINKSNVMYFKKIVKPSEEELKNHKEYLKQNLKKNYFN